MKKKILLRCLIGASIGLTISTIITILISFSVGDGHFYPVVPALAAEFSSEINAVSVQAVCSLLYGAVMASATLIFEQEHWSILRQTMMHLLVISLATLPLAYLMHWMQHSTMGILLYFSFFFGIYLLVWLIRYSAMKKRVAEINRKVQQNQTER